MSLRDDLGWLLLMIPAPVWGPALGLATYAYHRRRTVAPAVPQDRNQVKPDGWAGCRATVQLQGRRTGLTLGQVWVRKHDGPG